jgi:alpha-beta hydrolase superfamily lysophospholipase
MRYHEDRIEKLTCCDGKARSMHIWEPGKPERVFLAVHGALDNGGNFCITAFWFRDHGIATVACDQQGHDHQGPDHPTRVIISRFEVFLEDLERMVTWVKDRYPELPVYILAHSAGGLIATHFGIRKAEAAAGIRGFILSAPYYVNAVKTPPLMKQLAGILSAIVPRLNIPIENFLPHVSHDPEIYERHISDVREGFKVTRVSARFGGELLKAQAWIPGNISRWTHPMLAIIAGDDKVADAPAAMRLLGEIPSGLLTELYYPENYHENFNELNRNEIFAEILQWVEQLEGA